MKPLRLTLFLTATIILGTIPAHAATLFGKVIEVTEGDVLTVMNMKRPARIRLIGVDAPEKAQPFGDVSRQHLSDLVLGQNVVVEYLGIGRDGTIVGRVLLNNADMNAQMIRDGAAWFDPSFKGELGEEQRDIYSQSEQAARDEKRGLWQTGDAVAPWEFVKNREAAKNQSLTSVGQSIENVKPVRSRTELTSESLIRTGSGRASLDARMNWVGSPDSQGWNRFQPTGERFSAILPTGGKLSREPVPFGDTYIDVNYYVVREGASVYTLMWATGPATAETDSSVIKSTLMGFLRGVGAGFESLGGKFSCEPGVGSEVSAGGFTGRGFSLTGCTVPAVARVFTKAGAGQRQVYLGAVFYASEDENVSRFMKSFTIGSTGSVKTSSEGSR